LNIPRMRNIEVKLPPQEGQAAIVKYLAHANARIDKAISAKRRLVALLEEQRDHQSRELLANALERSLEQTDSGYGWIGQVPSSWRKFRLKALATLLRTRPYIDMFRSLSTGIRPSRLRFYPDQMLATPVFLPPLSEQKQIIASIESSAMRAQAPIEKVQREIALLREFWTRLVADVVTGQVDVRAIAATLPEAPEAVADHAASSGDEFADLQEEDL
jgi:restriction endonuclease S subunit